MAIRAIYENGVFRPLDDVPLAEKTEVLVEAVEGRPRSREALLAVIRAELPRLRERHHVSRLILFGSGARDELTAESDVDFAVELDEDGTFEDLVDVAGELTLLLGRSADVVSLRNLKPGIRAAVDQEGLTL